MAEQGTLCGDMSTLVIDIADRAPRPHPFRKAPIRRLLTALCEELLPEADIELSISLVGDRRMRQLNRDYRGYDKTTDVLSFPLEPDLRSAVAGIAPVPSILALGDIVISPKVCLQQASDWGWTPGERLAQLLIHGLLHLLGYDHELEPERLAMEALEDRLLAHVEARDLILGLYGK